MELEGLTVPLQARAVRQVGGAAAPMERGPYNDVQSFIDDIGQVEETETAVGELYDAAKNVWYNADKNERELNNAIETIARYVEDAGSFKSPEKGALLEKIAKQSPRTFDTLYRGIRIESEADYKKFMSSIKKGNTISVRHFTVGRDFASTSIKEKNMFTYNFGDTHQINIKFTGKQRGLDLTNLGEHEVIISSNQKVKVKSVSVKNGVTEITVER